MTDERLVRSLAIALDELAAARTPDYLEAAIERASSTSQRPVWTFPERWLPMDLVTRRPVLAPNVPWRTMGTLALLGLLIAVALAAYVGSQARLPAPFGVARNGLIAYSADGDIYTADPVTGTAVAVVTGPEMDRHPLFSLDGTRFVFERSVGAANGPGLLYAAKADGTGLTRLTPEPLSRIDSYAFSPNGLEILVSAQPKGAPDRTLLIARTDGTGIRALPVGKLIASEPDYAPPDGGEIVFVGSEPGQPASGLYVVKPDGSGLRPLVEPSNLIVVDPKWSSDGSGVAYSAYAVDYETGGSLLRAYVVSADGLTNRVLRVLPENDLESTAGWSNDGTRLLISGCYYDPANTVECAGTFSVVPVDGSGPAVEIDVGREFRGGDGTTHVWAPDDGSILTTPLNAQGRPLSGPLFWDPLTGRSRTASLTGAADPSWQRRAP